MSKPMKEQSYRTLFIGLGGTGGRVLHSLNKLLSDREKEKAHMIYIDLDKGDAEDLEALGMNTVVISSSDTVRDVISRLGPNDGVQDWIPTAANDKEFLSSKTDDGASQYRMKSRLCLANFLQNRNNKLAKLLTKLCKVGAEVSDETLRVMIVSSVAGGTGAGTFIQVALYIREFFRKNNHKDVNIMGLFACPDLYAKTLGNKPGDRTNLENMYANAYAAIRELNAMNLAVSTGGLDMIAPGYGKTINIQVKTRSEGRLFDPKDDKFLDNANNKPFNLLYFVDSANEEGGVLTSIEQYYAVMADIVYTRLYSPIEESIRSGESNELGPHSKYPTAIYGSAGYGRIIYPYNDIIRYLAVRKTSDEVGGAWFAFEDAWQSYCRDQQAIVAASGGIWKPSSADRARQYISEMDKGMNRKNSRLITMKGMMIDPDTEQDRATRFLNQLDAALTSNSLGTGKDGIYSRCSETEIKEERDSALGKYNSLCENGARDPMSALSQDVDGCILSVETFGNALVKNMEGAALSVAGVVVPQGENAAKIAAQEKDALNLFYGLLTAGDKPVHPLAARYLLYKLRDGLRGKMNAYKGVDMESTIREQKKAMDTAMDSNSDDGIDVTMADYFKNELNRTFVWDRAGKAKNAVEKFTNCYQAALVAVADAANRQYKAAVYEKVLEYVDELVAQYEGLFDNLEQYKLDLDMKTRQEGVRNNSSSDDRCIFVNASRDAKAFIYERDAQTRNALKEGDEEIASAAGKGIYESLMERVWKKIDAKKEQMGQQFAVEEEVDNYSDMKGIFENIIDIYTKYLKEKAPHLQVSVVDALVNQCCLDEGIERKEMGDPAKRRRLRSAFEDVIHDMIARAYPMLAYDPHNADTYYQSEDGNTETKYYMHIGMHPGVVEDLGQLYGENDAAGAKEGFEEAFAPSKGLTVSDKYDKYTISCFSAVHCLQPTQILKFREDFDDGYYFHYKKRLAMISTTGCLSFSPHLDKRWHLREAMPYISRSMELEWHKKTTKAFVYEMLQRNFTFTTAADGMKCFNYRYDETKAPIFVHFPADKLVTVNDISRLIEYLEEQDERVEELNKKFDAMIDKTMDLLSKYTESMPIYKAALTKEPVLQLLRENLCGAMTYISTATAKRGSKKTDAPAKSVKKERAQALKEAARLIGCDESVEALVDVKNTLGGLLQLAWLVHKSEERQDRDKDYGEAIIGCALEIVEKLCRTMYGSNVNAETAANEEYKDLYNSIIEKFMEAYVKFQLVQRNMFNKTSLDKIVGSDGTGEYDMYNRYLKIPHVITKTNEFGWINAMWKLK